MNNNFKVIWIFIILVGSGFTAYSQTQESDLKILSEGVQSHVEKPFILVARDVDSYRQLQKLIENLPAASQINFNERAVVAVFAGTKPTGGYGVRLQKIGSRLFINLSSPPKGAIVTQMLTQPFSVVSVQLTANQSLNIAAGVLWMQAKEQYLVQQAEFNYSGGIAGIRKSFKAGGTIMLWKYENYLTALFDLRERRGARRSLNDLTSGVIENNRLKLSPIEPGSFVQNPHPAMTAEGAWSGKNLTLSFKSLPTRFADGFTGNGSLSARRIR